MWGTAGGDSSNRPPYRVRGRLYVAGLGSRVGVRAGGRSLLGAFAESSVHEDIGCGDAVVGGGVFSDALSDVVEHEDDFASAVGFGEDGVGEIERRVGWYLLGCGGHGYSGVMIGDVCILVKGLFELVVGVWSCVGGPFD